MNTGTRNFSIVALKLSQQRAECYSVLGVALLALAFIHIFGGMLHSVCFISRICITVVGLVRSSFLCTKVTSLLLQFLHVPLPVVVALLCVVFKMS